MRWISTVLTILAFFTILTTPLVVRADGAVCKQSFAGEERDFPCVVVVKDAVANVFVFNKGEHVPYYQVKIRLPSNEGKVAEKSCPGSGNDQDTAPREGSRLAFSM